MFESKIKNYKGKCPHCKNLIEYFTIKFPTENDYGEMICSCSKCTKLFKVLSKNPNESNITDGATKKSYIDEAKKGPSAYEKICDVIQFQGSLFGEKKRYDYTSKPLYVCTCNNQTNLEDVAYSVLKKEKSHWEKVINMYTNVFIAGNTNEVDNIILKCDVHCSSCQRQHSAFFYKKYNDNNDFKPIDFMLGTISNSLNLNIHITETLSKNDFMNYLMKLISRWELLFDQYYLIFPYIGSPYSKPEEYLNILNQLVSQIQNSKKANIKSIGITFKSQPRKQIDNLYGENAYNFLKEYRFLPGAIDKNKGLARFHSKIYCGLRNNKIELYSGSANLMYGLGSESMTMNNYTSELNTIHKRFLSHFIPEEVFHTPDSNDHFHLIIDQSTSFTHRFITQSELVTLSEI